MILAHVRSEEARRSKMFQSWWTQDADKDFTKWRSVSCKLCFAATRKPEPDHAIDECQSLDSCGRARAILEWFEHVNIAEIPGEHCSVCAGTNRPCMEKKCTVEPVVKRRIVALWAYDSQILGQVLTTRSGGK